MVFNPNDPISLETIKKALVDHESYILNINSQLNSVSNLSLSDSSNTLSGLKVFSKRISFPINETLGKIKFSIPFSVPPTVTLSVEQKDPFFVTAVIKSVTNTDVDYAIFYSGNVSVQNYTLHVIAIGY